MIESSPAPENGEPIRIGISACLLGQEVRFDGGHKRNEFLVDMLGRFVEFVPVRPEVDLGLGVPRETLRLLRDGGETRLVANKSGVDHTAAMNAYARKRVAGLGGEQLSGYVLKKDSPSCGMERVRAYRATGMPARAQRRWPVRGRADAALSKSSYRGGGAPQRSATAREFRRAHLRLSPATDFFRGAIL